VKELDRLLSDGRYGENCKRIAEHVQSEIGSEEASTALEECFQPEYRLASE
jgi:hypothetical protein